MALRTSLSLLAALLVFSVVEGHTNTKAREGEGAESFQFFFKMQALS